MIFKNYFVTFELKKIVAMKKLIITAVLCLGALFSAKGQTIFTCEYRTEADVKVYVTNYKNEADLIVYKCDYRNEADLVIYFTHYRNEAGWRNEEKKHLMEG